MPFPLEVPRGFHVELVSSRVEGARFLAVAPNGDIIVSEVGRGQVVAVHPGSAPDTQPMVVARGVEKPNGLAFRGNDLYIATWSGIVIIPDYPRGIGSPGCSSTTCRETGTIMPAHSRLPPTAESSFLPDPTATSARRRTLAWPLFCVTIDLSINNAI